MTARERIVLLLLGLVVATGCSTGAESVVATTSAVSGTTATGTSEQTTAAPETTSLPSTTVVHPSGDDVGLGNVLLVGRQVNSPQVAIAVIAADGTDLATFEAPVGIGQGIPFEVFSFPGSGVALIGSQQGLTWLDRSDLELMPLGGDVTRMEWYESGSRYAVISVRSNYEVVDLFDGSRQGIGLAFKLTRAAVSGEHIAVSVFSLESEIITTVLDRAAGTAVSLPSGDQLGIIAIDSAGGRLLVERRTGDDDNQMTQFVVSPLTDPLDQSVWFETRENATASWAGDELVVVEFPSGTVTVADAAEARVIGTLPVEPRIVGLTGDRGSTAVLAQVIEDAAHRWYHIDSKRGTIGEVTEASGLGFEIKVEAVPGYQLVSDATSESGYLGTRLAAIRIADGELIELDSSENLRAIGGQAIGDAVLMTFTPGEPVLRLLDLDTGAIVEIDHGFSALLSPDGSKVAVGIGDEGNQRTVLVDIGSGTDIGELTEGFPVAWLGAVTP